ncbi:coiled-coil domain-containing protein [Mucilaginibacter myungsuensis]|uniref:Tail length tape measure protein n=1 Tax=Mucilaginibacter myungsuensis TaxID=649104 RepID=A0A929KWK7_9SPHI|nr:hypothetical protein [Mucilaginibacter myungsuensis]MBE9662012.1 hypothetical protein [Mucilaginibacter myungsuensis]MDN3599555.1 hypothetical protein [Mucilaginibacter myungsuensis]
MANNNLNGITDDEIKKTEAYADALNNVNASLSGLSSKLPSFADGLEAGLGAIAEKLPELVDSMTKLNAQNKELAASGQKPKSVLKELASSFLSWNNALSIGITLVTAYGPKILSFIGNLFESKKAKDAAQALKDYKDVLTLYSQNLSKERGEMETLLAVAKNEKIAKETRLEAIRKLNALSPEYLGSLTLANIKTAEGTLALDEYTKALKRKALAEAIQPKMSELLKERSDITEGYQAAQKDAYHYRLGKKKNKDFGKVTTMNQGSTLGTSSTTDYAELAEKNYKVYVDKDADILKRIRSLDKLFEHQLKGLVPTAPKQKQLTGKSYWEDQLIRQQTELNALKAGETNFEASAKPIFEKIKKTREMLAKYQERSESPSPSGNGSGKTQGKEAAPDLDLEERLESQARMATITLNGYAKEIALADQHFTRLKEKHKGSKATLEQLEKEHLATVDQINQRFKNDGLVKLNSYKKELNDIARKAGKNATDLAIVDLEDQNAAKNVIIDKDIDDSKTRQQAIRQQLDQATKEHRTDQIVKLQGYLDAEMAVELKASAYKTELTAKLEQDKAKIESDAATVKQQEKQAKNEQELQNNIQTLNAGGHNIQALEQQKILLDMQFEAAKANAIKTNETTKKIDEEHAEKKKAIEEQLVRAKIHAGDKYLDAVLKHSNKNSAIFKAAFVAKKAVAIADIIIDTKKALIASFTGYASMPFIGQALAIAQGAFIAGQAASSIAEIAKQKPGFARGGQFVSDGRGALLGGYSRADDTNAYLRSGEAVVVSEAMRNPWARNLVSAINVAHGGRDFSIAYPTRGYAMGGVFTDGGNANRYYNQPVTDVKDLANTLAYQMINNFPPIYVDVKDVNNQQNILAQTVDRVTL